MNDTQASLPARFVTRPTIVHLAGDEVTESGEELFEVFLDPETAVVWYRIRAASRPQAALARIGQPIARALQARFRRASAAALKRATKVEQTTEVSQ